MELSEVDYWDTGWISSGFSAAIARMSSVIFIEQYFGPHMLQKWALLNVSCGSASSWYDTPRPFRSFA
jgi:hypothetical protein